MRTHLVFFASILGLAGCSSSPGSTAPSPDAGTDAATLPDGRSADREGGSGCTCVTVGESGGLSTTDLACVCAHGCDDYSIVAADLCSKAYYMNVDETTFAGCTLKMITYDWGASGQVRIFDGSTGALVGLRSDDDTPGQCPGTNTPIGPSLAAGTYEPPASCGQPTTHPLCPNTDGGPDGSRDARAD
jgi:hypothetical protein